jgi:hypothetical protein
MFGLALSNVRLPRRQLVLLTFQALLRPELLIVYSLGSAALAVLAWFHSLLLLRLLLFRILRRFIFLMLIRRFSECDARQRNTACKN